VKSKASPNSMIIRSPHLGPIDSRVAAHRRRVSPADAERTGGPRSQPSRTCRPPRPTDHGTAAVRTLDARCRAMMLS
jgi:hypothetical protein